MSLSPTNGEPESHRFASAAPESHGVSLSPTKEMPQSRPRGRFRGIFEPESHEGVVGVSLSPIYGAKMAPVP